MARGHPGPTQPLTASPELLSVDSQGDVRVFACPSCLDTDGHGQAGFDEEPCAGYATGRAVECAALGAELHRRTLDGRSILAAKKRPPGDGPSAPGVAQRAFSTSDAPSAAVRRCQFGARRHGRGGPLHVQHRHAVEDSSRGVIFERSVVTAPAAAAAMPVRRASLRSETSHEAACRMSRRGVSRSGAAARSGPALAATGRSASGSAAVPGENDRRGCDCHPRRPIVTAGARLRHRSPRRR